MYHVQVMLVRDTAAILANIPQLVSFELIETHRSISWYGQWVGLVRPELEWRSTILQNPEKGALAHV
jgi:hypothetical protein